MKIAAAVLATVALLALGVVAFAYSGLYDVAATTPHRGPVAWLVATTVRTSIERRAAEVEVPDLDDPALAIAGAGAFATMCAVCHGAPGQTRDALGQGLNPLPPDLAESGAHATPAELFWVTKYGIKFTGMPAWGPTHSDQLIWSLVAFMLELPDLDAEAYEALLPADGDDPGPGHHHHGDGHHH